MLRRRRWRAIRPAAARRSATGSGGSGCCPWPWAGPCRTPTKGSAPAWPANSPMAWRSLAWRSLGWRSLAWNPWGRSGIGRPGMAPPACWSCRWRRCGATTGRPCSNAGRLGWLRWKPVVSASNSAAVVITAAGSREGLQRRAARRRPSPLRRLRSTGPSLPTTANGSADAALNNAGRPCGSAWKRRWPGRSANRNASRPCWRPPPTVAPCKGRPMPCSA